MTSLNDDTILKFDRNPVSRLVSCAAVFGSAALVFVYLSESANDIDVLSFGGLILLFLGTFAAMICSTAITSTSAAGRDVREPLADTGSGSRGRWMRWEDIVEVREIRRKVLVLLSRDGRRMLVDAILGYAIARAEILRRAPQAIVSGTLARDDA